MIEIVLGLDILQNVRYMIMVLQGRNDLNNALQESSPSADSS
jgi:hypothetical protein